MSKRIYKNYQVDIGTPFQFYAPFSLHTPKSADLNEINNTDEIKEESDLTTDDIVSRAIEEAELIVKQAQREAECIISKAENYTVENSKLILQESRKEGFNKGYQEAQKKYQSILKEADDIRKNALSEYKAMLSSVESDIVNMVIDIAKKVISTEIDLNKESILYLIRNAIEKCINREGIVLKVSDDDYDYIYENMEKLRSLVDGVEKIEVKREPSLGVGNCIVETLYGSVDAGIETKLRKIEKAFLQVTGGHR